MEWIKASIGWFGRTFLVGEENGKDFIWTPESLGPVYGGRQEVYGGINYNIWIEEDGDYEIEGEVWAPDQESDSLFVEVWRHKEDGSYDKYDFGSEKGYGKLTRAHWRFEFAQGNKYKEWCIIKVNHVDMYVKPQQSINPIRYHMKKGEYLVKITVRENGAKLSKFRVVK